ncbi:hypothetical protein EHQ31_17000 [Leptospira montravelensis]|uniref:FAD/FMN-containing dehydrogenase n=1 Tax=Leptospira montravelensis TaxID=2484961 RepID=A0ABY2LMU3_9LEPT|nr:hypothetical protein [Leptospira montravelensis]TGK80320.1 hypothetical protein EHQ19_11575 [Leptospira montravelensis]TGL00493.1 hypothetical protein EHQ31_17000 [Leptospira montravelensis]
MNQIQIIKNNFVLNLKSFSIFRNSIRYLVLLPILILNLSLFAEEPTTPTSTLVVGNSLPEINYTNQWEEPSPIPLETTKVIFISDMDASKIIHPILEKEGKGYLEGKQAVLISDIHKMPSLITKFVALPKMKSYPYTLRLVREEKIADPFPRTKGSLTLIQLKAGKITKIQITNLETEIRSFLETPQGK